MSDFQTNQHISVETDMDRVVLTISRTSFPLPYATAFLVASGVKMAATHAMRVAKEPLINREDYMALDRDVKVNEVSPEKRSTMLPTRDWKVQLLGEEVLIWFGNVRIGLHFTDALKISGWLRSGAAQAKNWAGDTGKRMHLDGWLTNAEDDYRLGLQ